MHKQSSVERIYLPRNEGGRRLLHITNLYKKCIINTYHYLTNSSEPLLKSVVTWSSNRGQKSFKHKAEKYCAEIEEDINTLTPLPKKTLKPRLKNGFIKTSKKHYENSALHGQYAREIKETHIDRNKLLA